MRRNSLFVLVPFAAALVSACDDGTGIDLTPVLVADTTLVAAPSLAGNQELPSALDVTGDRLGGVYGGRFPERAADAGQWDFAVRVRRGELVLLPPQAIQSEAPAQRSVAITHPISGETFEGLREAPAQSTFVSDSAVVLREGAVYVARSRDVPTIYGSLCPQFAKLMPIDVDLATGRARIAIVTNEGCADPRLVPE